MPVTAREISRIKRTIYLSIGPTRDWEDAVQDGLERIVRDGLVDADPALQCRVAVTGAIDAYRRHHGRSHSPRYEARRFLVLDPFRSDFYEDARLAAAVRRHAEPGPEDVLDDPILEARARVLAWAAKRPERTQRIVALMLEGATMKQAAEAVGITEARVSQILGSPRTRGPRYSK